MNKKLKKYVRRYFVSALALLVMLSIIGVNLVFAKYVSYKDNPAGVTINSYSGEISVALRDGETTSEWLSNTHGIRLLPGSTFDYDPYVYIENNTNERTCCLFVKVEEIGGTAKVNGKSYNFDDFIEYTVASGWTPGDGENIPSNVYYRHVEANTKTFYPIFHEDIVTVKENAPELGFIRFLTTDTPAFGLNIYAVELTELDTTDTVSAWNWIMNKESTDSESDDSTDSVDTAPEIIDFGGADYNIYGRDDRHEFIWGTTADVPNDIVERTVAKRNDWIEKTYNVNINQNFSHKDIYIDSKGDNATTFINAISAGVYPIDLVIPDYLYQLEYFGLLRDMGSLEYIDLSESHWTQEWNDVFTYNDKIYLVLGDANSELYAHIEVVFFNTNVVAQRGFDPYQMVRDNTWTMDEMHVLAKQFVADHANDNLNMTAEDLASRSYVKNDKTYYSRKYNGIDTEQGGLTGVIFGSGLRFSEKNNDGTLKLIADSRTVNYDYYESARDLVSDKVTDCVDTGLDALKADLSAVRWIPNTTPRSFAEERSKDIANGNTLFSIRWLGGGDKINDLTNNYGFVPMPKYDKNSDYTSTVYGVSPFAIPINATDLRKSAVILDAMNYYCNGTLPDGTECRTVDSIFDWCAPGENFRENANLVEMVEILKGSLHFDFLWYNCNYDRITLYWAFYNSIYDGSKDINHEYEKYYATYETSLAKVMQIYYGAGTAATNE